MKNSKAHPRKEDGSVDWKRIYRPIRPIDHRPVFARMTLWAKALKKDYCRQLYPEKKDITYADPSHQRRDFDGDRRLANCRRDLMGFDQKPIDLQLRMHEADFSVEGPLFYGEDFFANNKLILEKNGWKRRISLLFICAERKVGKTVFLGQKIAILLMNIPGIKIACVSKTLDQAMIALAMARKLFQTHTRRNQFSITVNQAKKFCITNDSGIESEVRANAGDPDVCIGTPPVHFFVRVCVVSRFICSRHGKQRTDGHQVTRSKRYIVTL